MQLHMLTDAGQALHISRVTKKCVVIFTQTTAEVWDVDHIEVVIQQSQKLPTRVRLLLNHDSHNQISLLVTDQPHNLAYDLCFVQLEAGPTWRQCIDRPENINSGAPVASVASPLASNTVFTTSGFSCVHSAVSLYQGWVHLVSAYEWCDPTRRRLLISEYILHSNSNDEHAAGR